MPKNLSVRNLSRADWTWTARLWRFRDSMPRRPRRRLGLRQQPKAAGAAGPTPTTVWLCGTVTQGYPQPQAYFCLDTTDKGTTSTGAWSRVIAAGAQSGAFSNRVTGLTPNTIYTYRCYVTNAVQGAWAASAAYSTRKRC